MTKTRRQRKIEKQRKKIGEQTLANYWDHFLWFTMGRVDLVIECGDHE
jgi:hypothetical protein